jgi:hypothetical protein
MTAVTPAQKMSWLNTLCKEPLISATEFRIAYQLANHINNSSGKAWPGKQRLSETTCTSIRTVQRSIGKLVGLGFVTRSQRRGRSSLYELALDFTNRRHEASHILTPQRDFTLGHSATHGQDTSVSQTYNEHTHVTLVGEAALRLLNSSFAQRREAEGKDGVLADPKRAQWEGRILRMLGPDGPRILSCVLLPF